MLKAAWPVQLVVDEDQEYFREVMLGARRRAFELGRLDFADRWLPHEMEGGIKALVLRDGVRGIVAAAHDRRREAELEAAGVPVVNVSNALSAPRLPVVTQDDREAGRLAAKHLLGRGLRRFIFWGQPGARYSEERKAGFGEMLAAAGVGRGEVLIDGSRGGLRAGGDDLRRMRGALAWAGTRAGVFAVLDCFALAILRAAREEGRKVPEELAVLGAGDDDFFVEFESTPLSSIRFPARRIGYEAAAYLEKLIAAGGRRRGRDDVITLPGAEVVARRSSEARGPGDPLVARAAGLLRERPAARVADIARMCGVARSGLQRRFLAELGHGLLEERRRVRLARAEALLAGTDAKLEAVAAEAGYPSAQRLAADLKRLRGCTPGAWRRRGR
jgi:LacI family transcriptional regulator